MWRGGRFGRIVIVVDASVLVAALAGDNADGDSARARLAGDSLAAPELIDVEVVSVLRRLFLAGNLDARRADLALVDLIELPLQRVPHRPLLARCWELRDNVTPYDAAYIALAEILDAVLVTADARMSKAPGTRCRFDVVRSTN
jgi:predicted nucleic acid-binding protein